MFQNIIRIAVKIVWNFLQLEFHLVDLKVCTILITLKYVRKMIYRKTLSVIFQSEKVGSKYNIIVRIILFPYL